MHKALRTLLTLAVMCVCLPASAQTITNLTMNPDTIGGGDRSTATITLSAAAPTGGATVQVFPPTPNVIVAGDGPPSTITVPAGQTTATFDVATLPMDAAVSTFVGASIGGTTRLARLSVLLVRPFRARIAVF